MSVTLNDQMTNIPAFVASMFAPQTRDASAVTAAIRTGALKYSFADSASKRLILRAWLAAWQQSQGDAYDSDDFARCPVPDRALLAFVAGYIKSHALQLVEPQLALASMKTDQLARYRSTADKWHAADFAPGGAWAYGTFDREGEVVADGSGRNSIVARFLDHLYHGSHMVVVSAADDLGGAGFTDFRTEFKKNFRGSDIRDDPGNSHYTSFVNLRGRYYLTIPKDRLPASNPLIVAFLTAWTADDETNAFIQHEGWQAQNVKIVPPRFDGGPRHSADFDASVATLWNFSTYGASVHSEKRSTSVFLAPDRFSRRIDGVTHMPLYVGAGSLQGWMNPDLLVLR